MAGNRFCTNCGIRLTTSVGEDGRSQVLYWYDVTNVALLDAATQAEFTRWQLPRRAGAIAMMESW
jgi:hypothetical protein